MVDGGEAAEAGLDLALGGGGVEGEVGVEVSDAAEVIVGFVEGVEEVEGYDEDLDATAVGGIGAGTRGRARIAGADSEGVVDRLGPRGNELSRVRTW